MKVGDDATIGDIVRTKLGRELCYQFVEPMVGGIQAGRIDELSAKSVFPALLERRPQGRLAHACHARQRSGRRRDRARASTNAAADVLLTPRRGRVAAPGTRASARERGVVLRTGVAVTALRRTPSGNYPWEVDTAAHDDAGRRRRAGHTGPVTAARCSARTTRRSRRLDVVRSAGAAMITFSVRARRRHLTSSGTGVLVPLGTPWSGDGSMMMTARHLPRSKVAAPATRRRRVVARARGAQSTTCVGAR